MRVIVAHSMGLAERSRYGAEDTESMVKTPDMAVCGECPADPGCDGCEPCLHQIAFDARIADENRRRRWHSMDSDHDQPFEKCASLVCQGSMPVSA